MKRLSSYFAYINVLAIPLAVGADCLILWDILKNKSTDQANIAVAAVLLIALLYCVWFVLNTRRIYYDGDGLKLYKLFSNQVQTIEGSKIKGLEKTNMWDPFHWKLVYLKDSKMEHSVYFIRNIFCSGFEDIVSEFN